MPPQEPYTPPPQHPAEPQPGSHERYDFIMQPPQPKRSLAMPAGTKMMILYILGVVTVVVILLAVVLSLARGGSTDSTAYVKIAQQQAEIIRVSSLQEQGITNQAVKNFVINTELTLASDQQAFTALLDRDHIKVTDKQIAQGLDSSTDTALQNAQATSTLNEAVEAELKKELMSYQVSLKQAYQNAGSQSKKVLLELYNNAALLIQQSKQ